MPGKTVRPVPSTTLVSTNADGDPAALIRRQGNNVRVTPIGQEASIPKPKNPGRYDPGKPSDVREDE